VMFIDGTCGGCDPVIKLVFIYIIIHVNTLLDTEQVQVLTKLKR